jgi:hypothetical protein
MLACFILYLCWLKGTIQRRIFFKSSETNLKDYFQVNIEVFGEH